MNSQLKNRESKLEDIISRPEELNVTNDSLLASNEKLKSKIEYINQAKKASVLPSEHELVLVNKELVSTNEKFAAVNKQLISFNEQIKQHDITQADIINTTAHELKTLTHAILGYSELLQMDFEQDNDNDTHNYNTTTKVLKVIVRSANELQKLINDILNIAKIETQKVTVA